MKEDTRLIIQARTGASRLPLKTIRPFFGTKGIFRIIAENLAAFFGSEKIILATTLKKEDDELAVIAGELGIAVYRGSENDVLGRFIGAAETYNAGTIVRICADNPFIFPSSIGDLINEFEKAPCDYLSFCTDASVPVIRSHWGLFAEVTTLAALKKAAGETSEAFYHEHVTNYLYENPGSFTVRLLPLPGLFRNRDGYRFTLDTAEDFDLLSNLYLTLYKLYDTTAFTPEQLFGYLDKYGASVIERMRSQIEKNAK